MNTLSEIKNDIKTKNFSPIYLLMGEEEFYIDNITNLFIDHVLSEEEKQFNLNVLYGKESSVDQIISICKKYPLNVQIIRLVIIKEAQDLSRNFN